MGHAIPCMCNSLIGRCYVWCRLQSLSQLDVDSPPGLNRMSSIIATIGPACRDVEILEQMMAAGLDIARLNFSHGSYDYHRGSIGNVRLAASNVGRQVLSITMTRGRARACGRGFYLR